MNKRIFTLLIIIISFIGLYLYASKIEPEKLAIIRENIYVPHWNSQINGVKIGIISDLHIGTPYCKNLENFRNIVNSINNEQPDIIVLLGDFDGKSIQDSRIEKSEISDLFKQLKAPDGVFAILGNHDYEPSDVVENILKSSEIPVLHNKSRIVTHKGHKLRLVGFEDLWHHYLYPQKTIGEISPNIPVIALSHNPDIFPEIPKEVSLTLSGHTHGGEVSFPKIGSPFVPSKYGQRYRKGHIAENNKHLYVTSGIGTLSGFRLMNTPEIVILTIYNQTEDNTVTDTKRTKFFDENYIPCYLKLKSKVKAVLFK